MEFIADIEAITEADKERFERYANKKITAQKYRDDLLSIQSEKCLRNRSSIIIENDESDIDRIVVSKRRK